MTLKTSNSEPITPNFLCKEIDQILNRALQNADDEQVIDLLNQLRRETSGFLADCSEITPPTLHEALERTSDLIRYYTNQIFFRQTLVEYEIPIFDQMEEGMRQLPNTDKLQETIESAIKHLETNSPLFYPTLLLDEALRRMDPDEQKHSDSKEIPIDPKLLYSIYIGQIEESLHKYCYENNYDLFIPEPIRQYSTDLRTVVSKLISDAGCDERILNDAASISIH